MYTNKQADTELLKALKSHGIDDTGMKLAMKMRDAMSSLIDKGYHVDLGTDGEGVDLTISVGGVEWNVFITKRDATDDAGEEG